jgi:triose/dihydroxyacetone kinase / FAD-AMP lyase (cyclizing)
MDQAVGDGDIGISLARGATTVLEALPTWPLDDPAATLLALGTTLQKSLGGTSGPLYAMFFFRAAAKLRENPQASADAFRAGVQGIMELGGAKPGDRTMLDALVPASEAFASALAAGSTWADILTLTVAAAEAGSKATASMSPRKGRSSYLGERALGLQDPGAEAVSVLLRAIASTTPP